MISTARKLSECERELRLRYRVYPRWIANGQLTELQAKRRIETLEEIASDYRRQLETERPQLPLTKGERR